MQEVVILPLASDLECISVAVARFKQQFGETTVSILGHVTLHYGNYSILAGWRRVERFDFSVGLLGLGAQDEPEEELLWVKPTGPGQLKLVS